MGKRSAGAIQKLRGKMASINSQLSKIKAEDEDAVDDAENIKAKINTRNTELSAVEEKIQEAINEKEMLSDLIKEKEELFKQNKKELHQLKSATSPLLVGRGRAEP